MEGIFCEEKNKEILDLWVRGMTVVVDFLGSFNRKEGGTIRKIIMDLKNSHSIMVIKKLLSNLC